MILLDGIVRKVLIITCLNPFSGLTKPSTTFLVIALYIMTFSLIVCFLSLDRNDGSGIALKTLKRVQKGWGRESILSLQPRRNAFLDYWEAND